MMADSEDESRGISDDGVDGAEKKRGSEEREMKSIEMEDETSCNGEDEDEASLISSSEVDNKNGMVREYEVALKHLGFGFFHILLLVITGVVLSSEGVETYSISFVFPELSRKDKWGSAEESLIGSIAFVGMWAGNLVWGNLADMFGRKTALILSLLVSAIFGLFSAFIPWFWLFVFFRFICGFGVGGAFPIPYLSEFIRNKYRGPYLATQVFFWMIAQLTSVVFAWATIPLKQFYLFGYELESWRVYIAVCALPSFIGALMFIFLPESPRFLLQVGKHQKALKILRGIHRLNHLRKYVEYPVKFILLDGVKHDRNTSKLSKFTWRTVGVCCKELFLRNIDLFRLKFLRQTVLLLIIIFCLASGNFGIILWYPTYVNQLTTTKDVHDLQEFCNTTTSFSPTDKMASYCGCSSSVFQDTTFSLPELKKWRINDVLFRNVTFLNVNFDSVLFNGTEFRECKFKNCTFTRLFFNATHFNDVQFQSVNILPTSLCLFSNTSEGAVTLKNVTFSSRMVESLNLNISKLRIILESDVNLTCNGKQYGNFKCKSDDFRVYRYSFLIAVSVLPGGIASAIAVYFLRRNYWLAFSMFVSAVSVFLLYIVTSEIYMATMLCFFNAISTPSWNNFNLIVAELYPTHIRNTAAGLHRSIAMIGAILGTNLFGFFVKVNPSIPILLTASLFLVAALCSLGVPTTTRKTLLK